MQLQPQSSFSVVRQIEDHTDQNTYYVRAVIRNAITDAIITVNGNNYLNLTDRGSQRFSKTWQTPADPSGQGFYISILTSVYTDSGYTTKSENYGDKMETYLVQARYNPNLGNGGGGGSDISYKKIREIVNEVVKERLKDIDIPEQLSPKVIETEKVIVAYKEHPKVEIPSFPSFAPILSAIKEVGKKVDAVEIPEQKEMDMKPMMECLSTIQEVKKIVEDDSKLAAMEKNMESRIDKVEKIVTPPPPPPAPTISPYEVRSNKLMGKLEVDEKLSARAKKLMQ